MSNTQCQPGGGGAVTKVVLVDDHGLVREGLRLLLTMALGLTVIGETGDGAQVERLVRDLNPDLLVLDLELPGCHGIEVARRIKAQAGAPKILVLTGKPTVELLRRAFAAGVEGYLVKHEESAELLLAVQTVLAGSTYVSKQIAAQLGREAAEQSITRREREVVGLVAGGLGNAEIAASLHISPHTVRTHRKALMAKLGLHNAAEITAYAVKNGYYEPG
jgi:DNA-binding NarL/FixJ family response regulator